MPQQWKDFQITAGSLVAFIMGLLAMGATFVSFQSWLGDRIVGLIASIDARIGRLESAHELDEQRYIEVRRMLKDISSRLPEAPEDAE